MAIARCSRVTGEGAMASNMSYRTTICAQPVSCQRGASAWQATIAACSWVRPCGELLDAVDPVTLREIVAELQAANDVDAIGAAQAIRGAAQLPSGHLLAIASYAARAL
jgi:hypothetical protein